MESVKLIDVIKDELFQHTKRVVVDTDNNNKKPKMPFYSAKMLTSRQNAGEEGNYLHEFVDSEDKEFKYDYLEILESQPNAIISIMAYDKTPTGAMAAAYDAYSFFRFTKRYRLKEQGYIVVDITDIQDRTVLNIDNYEYRYGFDVRIRYVEKLYSRAANIEKYKVERGDNR